MCFSFYLFHVEGISFGFDCFCDRVNPIRMEEELDKAHPGCWVPKCPTVKFVYNACQIGSYEGKT